MKGKKAGKPVKQPTGQLSYRQGAKQVVVETVANSVAVQYIEGAREAVETALSAFGHVLVLAARRLAVVELLDPTRRGEALRASQQLVEDGKAELVTPVLRDPESDLRQILTDEVTVRFKSIQSPAKLKEVETKYGVSIARQNEFVPRQFVLKVDQPAGLRTLDVASALDEAEDVQFAAPNFVSEHAR